MFTYSLRDDLPGFGDGDWDLDKHLIGGADATRAQTALPSSGTGECCKHCSIPGKPLFVP